MNVVLIPARQYKQGKGRDSGGKKVAWLYP
jgi:hypothetical protein